VNAESPESQQPSDTEIRAILTKMRRVAVVGISDREDRASHGIAKFLKGQGLEVLPVNPKLDLVLGLKVYPSLSSITGPVDVVDIFRRSEAVPPIVEEAIALGAKTVWMQQGVVHEEAAAKARSAGLQVVMDRCIYQEWLRLMNR
jgi:predicted CoA-binding protein